MNTGNLDAYNKVKDPRAPSISYFDAPCHSQSQSPKAKSRSLTIMDQSTDFYGYRPSKPAALFGIVYFGTAMVICTLQMIFGRYPHYWMTTIALAGVGESLGWGARLWAHMEV